MTKDEVKLLCETNDKLQWWAMVLFAELMSDVPAARDGTRHDAQSAAEEA